MLTQDWPWKQEGSAGVATLIDFLTSSCQNGLVCFFSKSVMNSEPMTFSLRSTSKKTNAYLSVENPWCPWGYAWKAWNPRCPTATTRGMVRCHWQSKSPSSPRMILYKDWFRNRSDMEKIFRPVINVIMRLLSDQASAASSQDIRITVQSPLNYSFFSKAPENNNIYRTWF